MKFEASQQDLILLYNKAKLSLNECINDEENEFLKREVNIPVEDIIVKEESVKIVFSELNTGRYLFEVTLKLYAMHKEIGKYLYIENDAGDVIDDSLVFY